MVIEDIFTTFAIERMKEYVASLKRELPPVTASDHRAHLVRLRGVEEYLASLHQVLQSFPDRRTAHQGSFGATPSELTLAQRH